MAGLGALAIATAITIVNLSAQVMAQVGTTAIHSRHLQAMEAGETARLQLGPNSVWIAVAVIAAVAVATWATVKQRQRQRYASWAGCTRDVKAGVVQYSQDPNGHH